MFQLLYTSELALEEDPKCVAGIIRAARVNNARASITGVLAFDGVNFCQYLEGPRDAVSRLAETIAIDRRHICFKIHEAGDLLCARRFENVSMGYALVQCEHAIPSIRKPGITSPIERLERLLPSLVLDH